MQGKKDYTEKLFTNFQLSEWVPKDNFYRRLKEVLYFDEENKQYQCAQGRWLTFRGAKINSNNKKENSYAISCKSATAYNLKKYLKFTTTKAMSQAKVLCLNVNEKIGELWTQLSILNQLIFRSSIIQY